MNKQITHVLLQNSTEFTELPDLNNTAQWSKVVKVQTAGQTQVAWTLNTCEPVCGDACKTQDAQHGKPLWDTGIGVDGKDDCTGSSANVDHGGTPTSCMMVNIKSLLTMNFKPTTESTTTNTNPVFLQAQQDFAALANFTKLVPTYDSSGAINGANYTESQSSPTQTCTKDDTSRRKQP